MVTYRDKRGITLSANAAANAIELGLAPLQIMRGRGDFAARVGCRIRRMDRRARIASKRAWLES